MTTKHGTASHVTGIYVEFQAAVLRALPRDINPDVVLGWTQNGESLARVLREALVPDSKAAGNYHLSVDYGRGVEDGVKAGRYDWVNSDVNSRNFPTKRKGTTEVGVELIPFNRYILTDEALSELDRMGFRPAEIHELLAFGEEYPEVQREFPIAALGSVWQDPHGRRYVPYLGRRSSERYLRLGWVGLGWDGLYRFAVVRK